MAEGVAEGEELVRYLVGRSPGGVFGVCVPARCQMVDLCDLCDEELQKPGSPDQPLCRAQHLNVQYSPFQVYVQRAGRLDWPQDSHEENENGKARR